METSVTRSAHIHDLRWSAPLDAWLSGDQGFQLWHANGQPRLTVTDPHPPPPVYPVAPSPDGRWLYTLVGRGLEVWDAASGARHACHPEALYPSFQLCVSPDGHRLAAICSVHAGALLCAIDANGARAAYDELEWDTELEGLAFFPDSTRLRVVHFGEKGRLLVTERDPSTLKRLEERCLLERDPEGLGAFLDDSGAYVLYRRRAPSGTFDVFSLDDGTRRSRVTVPMSGTGDPVSLAAWGRWLAVSHPRGDVERWDLHTAQRHGAWVLTEPVAPGLAVAPDGTVAVALKNGQLALLR